LKLLLDQNLSRKLVNRLADIFPDLSHVQFHSLAEGDDREIWEFAKDNNFCIVTQDADFPELSQLKGSPPKVIWLRCGNIPTSYVEIILRSSFETIRKFMNNDSLDCLELYK
jgi:predicted nuclease of predicted toxin-antitoxin system